MGNMHSITCRFASYALVGVLILGCKGFVQGQIVSTGSFVPGAVRSISTSYKSHAVISTGKANAPLVSSNYRAQSGETAAVQNPPHPTSSPNHIVADEGATVVLLHEDIQALTSFVDVDGHSLTFLGSHLRPTGAKRQRHHRSLGGRRGFRFRSIGH